MARGPSERERPVGMLYAIQVQFLVLCAQRQDPVMIET